MSIAGIILYPILLSMNLPIFLHNIVFEKETKLIENMKINGLTMTNYYIVNACYNFAQFSIVAIANFIMGRFVLDLIVYTDSSW